MANNFTRIIALSVKESGDTISDSEIISDSFIYWIHILLFFGANCSISIVGMCGNVINIIVFLRQGILSDSNNTALLGLAFSDFLCLLTIFMTGVFLLILETGPENRIWDPEGVMLMLAGWPHVMFSQMACLITAYLSFERCICVSYPFKVKTLFSAKRSLIVVIMIYIFTVVCYSPVFICHERGWVNIPALNKTIFTIKLSSYYEEVRIASNYVNSFLFRGISIFVVLISTKITVSKVRASKKWKKSIAFTTATTSSILDSKYHIEGSLELSRVTSDRLNERSKARGSKIIVHRPVMSQKETRLVRIVTIICIIFLICYMPDIIIAIIRSAVPSIHYEEKHHNLYSVLYGFSFFMESFNSSINIFVYYRLSSKYKETFRKLFHSEV